jgi:hypothetical protein
MEPNETELRLLARARIDSGALSAVKVDHVAAGPGDGALCALCGVSVLRPQIAYEVPFDRNGIPQPTFFHIGCFRAWRLECDKTS